MTSSVSPATSVSLLSEAAVENLGCKLGEPASRTPRDPDHVGMGVMAYPLRYALADLALALSRASDTPAEVRPTAARAAADMIGDGAGVQLLGDDGRYDSITYHHIDDERSA